MGVYYEKGGEMPWHKGEIGGMAVRYIARSSTGETPEQAFDAVCKLDDIITNSIANGELVMMQKEGWDGIDLVRKDRVNSYKAKGWTVVPQE